MESSYWQIDLPSMPSKFMYAYEKGLFTDCSFEVDFDENESGDKKSKIFFAHKFVLACASPVFEKMLFGHFGLTEKTDKSIKIENVDADTFSLMLKYIYKGSVEINSYIVARSLFGAAHFFMIEGLKKICKNRLILWLNSSNVLDLYEFAKHYNENELMEKVLQEHTHSFISPHNLPHMDIEKFTILLEQNSLEVSEYELFKALEAVAMANGYLKNEAFETLTQFRLLARKINYFSMTAEEFIKGPAFSKLLKRKEALAILASINRHNLSRYPKGFQTYKRNKLKKTFDQSDESSECDESNESLESDEESDSHTDN